MEQHVHKKLKKGIKSNVYQFNYNKLFLSKKKQVYFFKKFLLIFLVEESH